MPWCPSRPMITCAASDSPAMESSKSFEPFLAALRRVLDGWASSAPPVRISVALSGGLDSSVLLAALRHLDFGPPLRALHVDHGLHPDSAKWSAHCAAFAKGLGVELVAKRVSVDRASGLGLVFASTPSPPETMHIHAAFALFVHGERIEYTDPAFDLAARHYLRAHLHHPDGDIIHIEGEHAISQVGKTSRGHEPHVADADYTDLFHFVIPLGLI